MKKFHLYLIITITFCLLSVEALAQTSTLPDSVYVTPSGSVYHLSKNCSYLTKSTSVKKVSIKEIGNRHACSRCGQTSSQPSALKSSATSTETYNGNKVYTGPKGGKYYINSSGNKVYIKH